MPWYIFTITGLLFTLWAMAFFGRRLSVWLSMVGTILTGIGAVILVTEVLR